MTLKIYTASSWRNKYYPEVVNSIREAGYFIYDFRNPDSGAAFNWTEIDKEWEKWSTEDFIHYIKHPIASKGFEADFAGMNLADVGILVTPSGRSSHMEIGYMLGQGKPCIVLLNERVEPELTYRLAYRIVTNIHDLLVELDVIYVSSELKKVVK